MLIYGPNFTHASTESTMIDFAHARDTLDSKLRQNPRMKESLILLLIRQN
jgi:hypothetical protein